MMQQVTQGFILKRHLTEERVTKGLYRPRNLGSLPMWNWHKQKTTFPCIPLSFPCLKESTLSSLSASQFFMDLIICDKHCRSHICHFYQYLQYRRETDYLKADAYIQQLFMSTSAKLLPISNDTWAAWSLGEASAPNSDNDLDCCFWT